MTLHLDPDTLAVLYELDGLTVEKIAQQYGCSKSTIHKKLLDAGVTMRPHSQTSDRNLTAKRLIKDYKRSAIRREISWSMSDQEAEELMRLPCYYCGALPELRSKGKHADFLNGIDRFDNSLGYFPFNAVACCARCNKAKSNRDADDFIEHAIRIADHQRFIYREVKSEN